jgi:hypothetical protein
MASRRAKTMLVTTVLVPLGRILYGQWQQRKAARNRRRMPLRGLRRRSS